MKYPLPHRALNSNSLRSAAYDENRQTLEIAFQDGLLRSYRSLPAEVAKRFFAAPNPASFWEDRIADEYPMTQTRITAPPPVIGADAAAASARQQLDALFQQQDSKS